MCLLSCRQALLSSSTATCCIAHCPTQPPLPSAAHLQTTTCPRSPCCPGPTTDASHQPRTCEVCASLNFITHCADCVCSTQMWCLWLARTPMRSGSLSQYAQHFDEVLSVHLLTLPCSQDSRVHSCEPRCARKEHSSMRSLLDLACLLFVTHSTHQRNNTMTS